MDRMTDYRSPSERRVIPGEGEVGIKMHEDPTGGLKTYRGGLLNIQFIEEEEEGVDAIGKDTALCITAEYRGNFK